MHKQCSTRKGQPVTFHVNGSSHQVVVLKPVVDIGDLGAEGIDDNGVAPETPFPPENNPAPIAAATGLPLGVGPGRWNKNANACRPGAEGPTDALRDKVFAKQPCPIAGTVVADYSVTFTAPGRYVFICNATPHYLDEGTTIVGPTGTTVFNGFGMHGMIDVID